MSVSHGLREYFQKICLPRATHTISSFQPLQRIILGLHNGAFFFNYLRCILHYKPEGRGFDSQRIHWEFLLT
jgi:hypothetical protein